MAHEQDDDFDEDSKEETFENLLNSAAKIVVNTCMEIRRHESVLVVADPSTSEIGQELYKVASKISNNVLLVIMPLTRHHGDEPPASVAELMRSQNVVLAPTKFSFTHTKARVQACKSGARIATMPGITSELFAGGGMLADFNEIRDTISRVGVHLRRRRKIRVTSPEGTDIRFEVDPKKWNKEDSGICNRPGMVTNLPAGKIFNSLIEGTAKGDLYIDGSFDSMVLSEPLRFKVNDGIATDIKGGPEAQRIRHLFAEAANLLPAKDQSSVWSIAQFGMGLNPNSKTSALSSRWKSRSARLAKPGSPSVKLFWMAIILIKAGSRTSIQSPTQMFRLTKLPSGGTPISWK